MDKQRRKELMEQYKEIKIYMGVIKITNTVNDKIFITTYPNLKNRWFTLKMQLNMGRHANFKLQEDWTKLGESAFIYEILEEKEVKEDTDVKWELKQMEEAWFEKLKPYGDIGYHKPSLNS